MQLIELPQSDVPPTALAFSPDGQRLAALASGRVFVCDRATGTSRTLWDEPDTERLDGGGLGFTADGRYIVARHAVSGQWIVVHDPDTGAEVRRHELPTHNCGFVLTPDGRTVLVAVHPTSEGATAEFYRWNPLTGERGVAFGRHRNVLRQLAISADGTWLAGTFGTDLRVWNVGNGAIPTRAAHKLPFGPKYSGFVVSLAISSDGVFVIGGEYRGQFRLVTVATGATHLVGPRARGVSRDAAFHPGRPLLASSGENEDVVFYAPAARTELKQFAWGAGDVTAVAFASDGLLCAAATPGNVVVWDVDA